jgi:hypothetical protein
VTLAPRGGRELAEDEDDAMDEMYLWKKGSDYHERIGERGFLSWRVHGCVLLI